MLELWLIRHAESLGNLDRTEGDTGLSARGHLQAAALGRALWGDVSTLTPGRLEALGDSTSLPRRPASSSWTASVRG